MKKFLVQILIFSLIIFVMVFILDEITFSDDFISEKTYDTEYKKTTWNLHMLNNEAEKIKGSSVFIGSSLVQGAINDSIAHSQGLKVYNFAVPHNGYDLNLYFADRLKPLDPKAIVFLQEKNAYQGLHKLTPLLNKPSDLLAWGQKLNFHFVSYLFKRAKLCTEYLVYNLKQEKFNKIRHYREYGIVFDNKSFVAGEDFSESFVQGLRQRDEYLNLFQNDFLYESEGKENVWLQRIKQTKRKVVNNLWVKNNWVNNNKSQRAFLDYGRETIEAESILFAKVYVPVLSDVVSTKNFKRSYFKQQSNNEAEVLFLKDFSFLKKPAYWSDNAHVNEVGAKLFSERFYQHFKDSEYIAKNK